MTSGVSKSQVSRLCAEPDERVGAFLNRPIGGEWPCLRLDATSIEVRQAGRIVSLAAAIAVAENTGGRREVLGRATGASEAGTFWTDFLRSLARRGLRGVTMVISDAHVGLKAAAARVVGATARRCRVHFMRNTSRALRVDALAHAGKTQRRIVSAWIGTAFAEADAPGAKAQWRQVADQLRPRVPRPAALMDTAEEVVLAFMNHPKEHRAKTHSSRAGDFGGQRPHGDPLERLNDEVKRRTDVTGREAAAE